MPKHSVTFTVATAPDAALEAARRIVVERGWSVEALTEGRLVARRAMRASTWPITVELRFAPEDASAGTQVEADGRIGGIGPIQRRALVRALGDLQASVAFEAGRSPGAAA
jgi:hypothetical protein